MAEEEAAEIGRQSLAFEFDDGATRSYARRLHKRAQPLQDAVDNGESPTTALRRIRELQQGWRNEYRKLSKDVEGWKRESYPVLYEAGQWDALQCIADAGRAAKIQPSTGALHRQSMESLTKALYNQDNLNNSVGRRVNDHFRKMGLEAARGVVTGEESCQQAMRKLLKTFQHQNIDSFTGSGTKNWGLKAYAEMVARTVPMKVMNEGKRNELIENGVDLVVIAKFTPTCPKCEPWGGAVLSVGGTTPGFRTIEEAEAAGLYHPNCRHSEVPYFPEIWGEVDDDGKVQQATKDEREALEREWEARNARAEVLEPITPPETEIIQNYTASLYQRPKNDGDIDAIDSIAAVEKYLEDEWKAYLGTGKEKEITIGGQKLKVYLDNYSPELMMQIGYNPEMLAHELGKNIAKDLEFDKVNLIYYYNRSNKATLDITFSEEKPKKHAEDTSILTTAFRKMPDSNELTVKYELFIVGKPKRYKGYAKRHWLSALNLYDQLDLTKIELQAGLDNGGYVWTQYGFRPEFIRDDPVAEWSSTARAIEQNLEKLVADQNISDDLAVDVHGLLEEIPDNPKAIWALADLKDQESGVKLGEPLLRHVDWEGLLDLNDEASRTRIEQYIGYVKRNR